MLCNGKPKQLLETGKRRRRRTVGVCFGCLPNPESGICSGTGGKEEEQEKEEWGKRESEMTTEERVREREVKDCVGNRVEVVKMYEGDGK
jgi:hypothetical protein